MKALDVVPALVQYKKHQLGLVHDAVVSKSAQRGCESLKATVSRALNSGLAGVAPATATKLLAALWGGSDTETDGIIAMVTAIKNISCATELTDSKADAAQLQAQATAELKGVVAEVASEAQQCAIRMHSVQACVAIVKTCIGDESMEDINQISIMLYKQPLIRVNATLLEPWVEHMRTELEHLKDGQDTTVQGRRRLQRLLNASERIERDSHRVALNVMLVRTGLKMLRPALKMHLALSGFLGLRNADTIFNTSKLIGQPPWSDDPGCDVPPSEAGAEDEPPFVLKNELFLARGKEAVWRYFVESAAKLRTAIQAQSASCHADRATIQERPTVLLPREVLQKYLQGIDATKLLEINKMLDTESSQEKAAGALNTLKLK